MAKLIVALDYTYASEALAMANILKKHVEWVKVGLELFTHEGPSIIQLLKRMGFKVMLDLKLFDIPNTVKGSVRSACLMGVDMLTLHILGGEHMIKAAFNEVQNSIQKKSHSPLLFGVTILTSIKQGELPGYNQDITSMVLNLAGYGQQWGLHGIVCSGQELTKIKALYPSLSCLTPGIRMSYSQKDDQHRVMTPREAVKAGSDFLVIGRPITQAEQPIKIVEDIISSIM